MKKLRIMLIFTFGLLAVGLLALAGPLVFMELMADFVKRQTTSGQVSTFIILSWINFLIAVLAFTVLYLLVLYRNAKRVNLDVRQQSNLLKTVFENSPMGIFTVNKQGVIESFNPKMVELSGAESADQALGSNVFDIKREVSQAKTNDNKQSPHCIHTNKRLEW